MKSVLTLVAALLLLLGAPAPADPGSPHLDPTQLTQQLTALKQRHKVRALVAKVMQGDREVLSLALGDSMTGVPATTDMHLRIGGISQTFTGTLVMMLVERGRLHLHDTIAQWLPHLPAADKVTVEMLLKNTSGYRDYVTDKAFLKDLNADPFRAFTLHQLIHYAVADGKLEFEPGSKQHYSHTNFSILAEVIEKATGTSTEELYRHLIFQPLGLEHTGYMHNADLPYPVLHAYSSDRDVYEDATFWDPTWPGESGPLYSTLPDLARWLRIHGKGTLLKPQSFQTLLSRPDGAGSPDLYMASGFVVSNGWYFQNPSFNGYSGAYGYLPSKDLTLIIFTTQSPDPTSSAAAFPIMRELIKTITPEQTLILP